MLRLIIKTGRRDRRRMVCLGVWGDSTVIYVSPQELLHLHAEKKLLKTRDRR